MLHSKPPSKTRLQKDGPLPSAQNNRYKLHRSRRYPYILIIIHLLLCVDQHVAEPLVPFRPVAIYINLYHERFWGGQEAFQVH